MKPDKRRYQAATNPLIHISTAPVKKAKPPKRKPKKSLPPGMVKCGAQGCRVIVKRTNNGRAKDFRCSQHQHRYNRRGGLKAEDLRLLALTKEE